MALKITATGNGWIAGVTEAGMPITLGVTAGSLGSYSYICTENVLFPYSPKPLAKGPLGDPNVGGPVTRRLYGTA